MNGTKNKMRNTEHGVSVALSHARQTFLGLGAGNLFMNNVFQQRMHPQTNGCRWLKGIATVFFLFLLAGVAQAQRTQPLVAIHDSEFTRALETQTASNGTPSGVGTTGFQWWSTNWHYFVMP